MILHPLDTAGDNNNIHGDYDTFSTFWGSTPHHIPDLHNIETPNLSSTCTWVSQLLHECTATHHQCQWVLWYCPYVATMTKITERRILTWQEGFLIDNVPFFQQACMTLRTITNHILRTQTSKSPMFYGVCLYMESPKSNQFPSTPQMTIFNPRAPFTWPSNYFQLQSR